MDLDFFLDRSQIYPPLRMNGPVLHPDASVEVSDFYGRLTGRAIACLSRPPVADPIVHSMSPLRARPPPSGPHRSGGDGQERVALQDAARTTTRFRATSQASGRRAHAVGENEKETLSST